VEGLGAPLQDIVAVVDTVVGVGYLGLA